MYIDPQFIDLLSDNITRTLYNHKILKRRYKPFSGISAISLDEVIELLQENVEKREEKQVNGEIERFLTGGCIR